MSIENLLQPPRDRYYKRPNPIPDVWDTDSSSVVNANTVGTPCLRYVVRQPDGHQDLDLRESGQFSFSAFGYRSEIGGALKLQSRRRNIFGARKLIAYCPNFNEPFAHDFFGLTSPSLFNFEVLDAFEQKKSLVGAAHLHLHASDLNGVIIVAFNGDGSLRYIENKLGTRRNHDSVLVYDDKVEYKIGSQLTGIRQKDRFIFDVPRWAFSEDMSAKVTILQQSLNQQVPEVITERFLPVADMYRAGHPKDPQGFLNRHIGNSITITYDKSQQESFEYTHSYDVESSNIGISQLRVRIQGASTSVELMGLNKATRMKASPVSLSQLKNSLQTITFAAVDTLDVDTLADYSEYLYMHFHHLLATRREGDIVMI